MRIQSLLCIVLLLTILEATAGSDFTLKTVVIDAGHGGKDPGAIGPDKIYEKDIALAVALKLGDHIKKSYPGVNVVYTRKTDEFIELHQRAEIANQKKADLFIAIHCNSNNNPQAYGSSCYVLGLHKTEANLEVAKRENSVILLEDDRDKNYEFDPNTPEGHIIMSMKQNAFLDQSISIASKVENYMESAAKRKSMGVKQAGFYVLYKTTMPSILAEIGFVSNPDEEKYLKSENGQNKIADALYRAFSEYKKEIEQSEGEQFAYEAAQQAQETGTTDSDVMNAAKQVVTDPKKETPAAQEQTTAVKPVPDKQPEATDKTQLDYVTLASGKKIRKPSESESGGGKATVVQPEPKTEALPTKATTNEPVKHETAPGNEPVKTPASNIRPSGQEKPASASVLFKIQLFALKSELRNRDQLTSLFGSVSSELLPNGITRYYGGLVNDYSQAEKLLSIAKANGYSSAFIVGFSNGIRMNAEQMKAFMH